MKLCLIAPVPPPYGGVSNWERIVEKEIRKDSDIELSLINIAANKRPTDGRTIFDQIFYSGFVMLRAYLRLKKYVRENKAEVVHMTTSGGLGFYRDLLLAKWLKKKQIPVVYHIHFGRTVLYKEKQGREWKQICSLVNIADHVVTIDKATYEIFKSYGDKVSYINNPIDVDTYNSYVKTHERKITYIGWIIKAKGIEELLQAFIEYNSEASEKYKLELIGPGDIKYLEYLKKNYSLKNVEFVGELEHERAMEHLASAEIFVLPSYTEGFPNVILEAMSLKKTIIATKVGAIPEMLDEGCGVLIEKQSVESIVEALKDTLGNQELQLQTGNRAYDKVLEKYDIRNTYLKYKGVWLDVSKHKRIMFYIDTMYRGGAQRVMSVLVQSFAEKGYEVALVNDFRVQDNNKTYQIHPQVKRFYLTDTNTGNPIVKNVIRIKELRSIIKTERPDIILSFLGRPNQTMLIAANGLNVKKVVSVRNDPSREYGTSRLKKTWINHLFSRADGIVFQTESAKKYFGIKAQRNSQVILNPVDSKFYAARRDVSPKNIIAVGRLEEQKNHKLLIRAFAEIANDYRDDDLIIYGDGSLRRDLEELVESLKLDSRVKLPGNVKNIEQVLADAKLFVMTSDYEGLPNALMEAMAVGVPCISTDCPCGGPKELIEDNVSGILVPCGDKDTLVKKMKKMLDDEKFRSCIGEQGRKRAENFRTEKVITEWDNFLTF